MDALVLHPKERTAVREIVPVPTPGCVDLLVQVEAVALNPVDSLYVRHPLADSKRTIGSDFAGSVAALGKDVPAGSNLRVGDRVAGFLQGACSVNVRPGAFANYLVVPWDLAWKIPDGCSTEQAAGVSLAALTAAQAVWYRLGLQAPFEYDEASVLAEHPEWTTGRRRDPEALIDVFIYGASTSVGLLAAQLVRASVKASGQKLRLSGAASKAKWEMLRSEPYCYDNLVDYHDDSWPRQVLDLVEDKFQYAYDCISEGSSVEKVSSLLADEGMMAIVRSRAGGAWHANHLLQEPIYGAVWEGLGEEVQYQGFTVPRSPTARQFAVGFYSWLAGAIGSVVQPVPVRSMPGGLEGIVKDGFSLLGSGQMEDRAVQRTETWMRPISAEKLVYRL